MLKVRHDAGFFSCCTVRLVNIIVYFNSLFELTEVDSSSQFQSYKTKLGEDVTFKFFKKPIFKEVEKRVHWISHEPLEVSFSDYSKIDFEDVSKFVEIYFTPSDEVNDIYEGYLKKYNIDLNNTCGIFYRGNDKQRESEIIPYQSYIDKANEYLKENPDLKFLVQPDETEFLNAFASAFPDRCINFEETPHIKKSKSAVFYEQPMDKREYHGQHFLAAVLVLSKCNKLITHSGNGGMWAILYRGNFKGCYQFIVKHIYGGGLG